MRPMKEEVKNSNCLSPNVGAGILIAVSHVIRHSSEGGGGASEERTSNTMKGRPVLLSSPRKRRPANTWATLQHKGPST